jgi:hypothetical protein
LGSRSQAEFRVGQLRTSHPPSGEQQTVANNSYHYAAIILAELPCGRITKVLHVTLSLNALPSGYPPRERVWLMMNPFLCKTKQDVSSVPAYCLIMLRDEVSAPGPSEKARKEGTTTSTAASSSPGVLFRIENANIMGTVFWLWFAWSRWVVGALRS